MTTGVTSHRERIAQQFIGVTDRNLDAYFRVYDQLLHDVDAQLQIEEIQSGTFTPVSHTDVIAAAESIRGNTQKSLNEVNQDFQARASSALSMRKANLTLSVAVRAMFMLDSTVSDWHGPDFTIGRHRQISWQDNDSLYAYVSKCFPVQDSSDAMRVLAHRRSLKAWKLRSRAGITFKPTDNIAQHLLLDSDNMILYVFHHTSFLKSQLARFEKDSFEEEKDLQAHLSKGTLPPRLLLETLHSIQGILFHWSDERSNDILERLISKGGFDEDCVEPESYKMFETELDNSGYLYWGHRLAEIYDHVTDRPAKNRFERWVKWQTSDSNAFAIALAALLISVVVGVLSLALSAVQVWIAWQAWKHPV